MAEYFVGVDLGGTNLRCALMDENRRIVARSERSTDAAEGSPAVIGRIVDGVLAVMAEAGIGAGEVAAACVGVPGPVDQESGVVASAPNMPGWENVPLADILRERTGIRTFIENDANCAGWGEFSQGAGRDCRHMIMITLGTGIGGAIILDGRLHTGRDGTAGEFGHMCIDVGGRPCGCGARGCIEAYASATAVARRFIDLLDAGWKSPLSEKRDYLTSRDVYAAAEAGDPVAVRIVEETGRYLGIMAASLAEALNPDRCIFAGGMILAGEMLFSAVRDTCLHHNCHPSRTMEIVAAELGPDAGLIGAATYAGIGMVCVDRCVLFFEFLAAATGCALPYSVAFCFLYAHLTKHFHRSILTCIFLFVINCIVLANHQTRRL